jgi:uncharacterized protein (DUF2235 family)
MRRLIVCSDGTWNSPASRTNIYQFAQAIAERDANGVAQVCQYFPGVGTMRWDRITGGAFGRGLSDKVKEVYAWLSENYQPGDELWFIGFSRGAFTVRSAAGLVRKVGLLPNPTSSLVNEAYKIYRYRDSDPDPEKRGVRAKAVIDFQQEHGCIPVEQLDLAFLGVFDTVGALGIPVFGPRSFIARRRWRFHDHELSSHVRRAYHAVAIDELRAPFRAALWSAPGGEPARDARRSAQVVEQRWFAGGHMDIGGRRGAPALHWMMCRAQDAGLAFKSAVDPAALPELSEYKALPVSFFYRFSGGIIRPVGGPDGVNQVIDESASGAWDTYPAYRPPNYGAFRDEKPWQEPETRRWWNTVPPFLRYYLRQYREGQTNQVSPR